MTKRRAEGVSMWKRYFLRWEVKKAGKNIPVLIELDVDKAGKPIIPEEKDLEGLKTYPVPQRGDKFSWGKVFRLNKDFRLNDYNRGKLESLKRGEYTQVSFSVNDPNKKKIL